MNHTSSTAVRETDIQFLNDTVAVGGGRKSTDAVVGGNRRMVATGNGNAVAVGNRQPSSRIPRPRTHRVNVIVPTDFKSDTQPCSVSSVTFKDVQKSSDVESSTASVVRLNNGIVSSTDVNELRNDVGVPSADRG